MTQSTPHTEQAVEQISAERDPLPGARYETRDVSWRSMVTLGVCIAAMVVGSQIGVYALLVGFQDDAKKHDPELSPLAKDAPRANVPPLQSTPNRDYQEFAKAQEAELSSYSAPDKQGRVKIPIERAMELIVERGLPAPAKTPAVKAEP